MKEIHQRKAGVLMHLSSLPGKYGIGDMGAVAVEFADFLKNAGIAAWQILPFGPTDPACAHSPYSSPSTFAGNILFISPDHLAMLGLIDRESLKKYEVSQSDCVDYDAAWCSKKEILRVAYRNFRKDDAYKSRFKRLSDDFWNFCVKKAYWLEDYALYTVLKEIEGGRPWGEWRPSYRTRDWGVLDKLKQEPEIAEKLDLCRFEQFIFSIQLDMLCRECRARGVEMIGDLPIYVACDSADVWGHQELFELDRDGRPTCVAGVPPDYFSKTGQRWGNPIYKWGRMREDGYYWWLGRFRNVLLYMDRVRIDHFRGFVGYWEIPAREKTAVRGEWRPGPGREFFHALRYCFADERTGRMPFIAEDLGVLTDDVIDLMDEFSLPGMKILQFAFGGDMPRNPYIPHNHRRNCAVYVGTHDNNTAVGWWRDDATKEERSNFIKYADKADPNAREAAEIMIRVAMSSVSDLAVLTVQDILHMDAAARMNTPSTTEGNWTWKLTDYDMLRAQAERIRELAVLYGRYCEPEEPAKKPRAQNDSILTPEEQQAIARR